MLMNKPDYLSLPIIDLSKTLMYEFWYDYVELNYGENPKLVIWIQTASFFTQKQKIFMKIFQKMLKKD